MKVLCCHDREKLEEFLRRDPLLYLYFLGDLDEFFWPHTTWYVLEEAGRVREAALLYTGMELPVLHALGSTETLKDLVKGIVPLLPRRFYAHLSDGLPELLAPDYRLTTHGEHLRMGLTDPSRLAPADTAEAFRLGRGDSAELLALYAESYPGNWFDPRMLETGFYFGLRREERLVSVAGIHVYSARYRVAALGNVTTHPDWRGQGLAKGVCARLCLDLLGSVDAIGLNVKSDNRGAIACYEALGFSRISAYGEYMVEAAGN